jgi:hypothetical protein
LAWGAPAEGAQIDQVRATTLFEEQFEDANLAARGWYDGPGVALSSVEHIPRKHQVGTVSLAARCKDADIGRSVSKEIYPVISFDTVAGKIYDVEHTRDLGSRAWSAVATNIAGNGGTFRLLTSGLQASPRDSTG